MRSSPTMNYLYQHNKKLTNFSRNNRKKQTDVEILLWQKLRNRQLAGYKFHRQYPVDNYILDFYCLEKKLAIELDGSQHVVQKQYDEKRTADLQKYGIEIMRFWDNEALQNIEGVLERIVEKLALSPPR